MATFQYGGFYMFDDAEEVENNLIEKCRLVTIPDYNHEVDAHDLYSLMHLNCRSIVKNGQDVESFLLSLHSKPQVCMFSETWLTGAVLPPQFYGYKGFHQMRSGKSSGGVSIYVSMNATTDVLKLPVFNAFEVIALQVMVNQLDAFLAVCVYRPPNTNVDVFFEELDSMLVYLAREYPSVSKWAVGGDFNVNLLQSDDHTDKFMDVLISHNLFPTIFKPTRPCSSSLLDNFFLSWPVFAESYLIDIDISDHLPILVRLNFNNATDKHLDFCVKRYYSQDNVNTFRGKLLNGTWENVLNCTDVNLAYNEFSRVITEAYNCAFPLVCSVSAKKVKYNNPWFTQGLCISSRKRSQMYHDMRKGKITKECYNKYRNMYVCMVRKAKAAYYCNLFDSNKRNVKRVWSHIRSLNYISPTRPKSSSINELNSFYADLGPNTVAGVMGNENYAEHINTNDHSFVLHAVSCNEIVNICRKLKSKTSCGVDGISTKLLQQVIDLIVQPLEYIINMSFVSGVFPNALKIAKVVPIFKGGDPSKLVNYRPVSILPSISKIFERLMYERVTAFCNKFNLLSMSQYGFRACRGTQDAVADLVEHVTKSLDEHKDVSALYVDIAKAFDSINHGILLHKMYKYGFRGNTHMWFTSYLQQRLQYVEVDGCKSLLRILRTGVPQGSVLGTLLFLLYINDLPACVSLPDVHFILFADDTTCLAPPNRLQEVCNAISMWFKSNKLVLNTDKTKHMLFSLRSVISPLIYLDGNPIELVKSTKFVGCIVDDGLVWKEHVSFVCKKMSQGIAMLRCVYNVYPAWVKKMIYFAYVYPYLCYCLAAWGNSADVHINRVKVLQKKSIRLMLNLSPLEHVTPWAKLYRLLLFDEKRDNSLAVFAFRNYMYDHNSSLYAMEDLFC
jgi:hypothetical protein